MEEGEKITPQDYWKEEKITPKTDKVAKSGFDETLEELAQRLEDRAASELYYNDEHQRILEAKKTKEEKKPLRKTFVKSEFLKEVDERQLSENKRLAKELEDKIWNLESIFQFDQEVRMKLAALIGDIIRPKMNRAKEEFRADSQQVKEVTLECIKIVSDFLQKNSKKTEESFGSEGNKELENGQLYKELIERLYEAYEKTKNSYTEAYKELKELYEIEIAPEAKRIREEFGLYSEEFKTFITKYRQKVENYVAEHSK